MTKAEVNTRKFLFDGVTNLFYSPEVKPETKEKIEIIKEFLEKNPEYNFVMYFNHIALNDPAAMLRTVNLLDPKGSRHLVVPSSRSHADSKKFLGRVINIGMDVLDSCGIEVMPVVQTSQVDHGYTKEEARHSYTLFFNRLKDLKNTNTPTGVLISPEGTRSVDGQLLQAESGIIAAGRLLAPVLYIPLAITYAGKFERDSMNIGKKMRIDIGEVTVQENPREYPSVEQLMRILAEALPEEMRGVWG